MKAYKLRRVMILVGKVGRMLIAICNFLQFAINTSKPPAPVALAEDLQYYSVVNLSKLKASIHSDEGG